LNDPERMHLGSGQQSGVKPILETTFLLLSLPPGESIFLSSTPLSAHHKRIVLSSELLQRSLDKFSVESVDINFWQVSLSAWPVAGNQCKTIYGVFVALQLVDYFVLLASNVQKHNRALSVANSCQITIRTSSYLRNGLVLREVPCMRRRVNVVFEYITLQVTAKQHCLFATVQIKPVETYWNILVELVLAEE